jgi:hypothetical protein
MKNIKYLFIAMLAVFFVACDDDFDTPTVTEPVQGTAPVLNEVADDIDLVLMKKNEKEIIVDLSWSAATFADPIGVRYYVQVDTVDNDFQNPLEFDRIAETKTSIVAGDLNTLITGRFAPAKQVELEVRIRAFANEDLNSLFSNSFTMKVTPYLDVPIPSEFFIYGTATSETEVSKALKAYGADNVFTKYLKLTKDGLFKFAEKQGDDGYDYNFGKFATTSDNIEAAGDDDGNFKFTGETGWYKVEADFVSSKLTITSHVVGSATYEFDYDKLYLVGGYNSTDPNWDPTNAVEMTRESEGIYTIDRILMDGAQFKFIGQQSWGDLDWGNVKENGNTGILGPKSFNGNITFDGADKLHTITVNLNNGTFSVVKKELPDLFLVGAATSNGWNEGNRVAMYRNGSDRVVYTYLKGKASDDDQFRFIDANNGWNGNFGFPFFSSVPSTITAVPNNGDGNMFFTGTTGIYKVTVTIDKDLQIEPTALGYDYPEMYIVGSINGWDSGAAPEMVRESEGVYTYSTVLPANAEFKFIGQQAWAEKEWADIDGSGDTGFIAPKDSNSNIKFAGDGTSTYKITFNLKAGNYTIVKQ